MAAFGAFEMLLEPVVDQGIEARHRFHDDAGATATVATVRPAFGDEFFTTERDAAFAAVTGFHVDFRFVDKFQLALVVNGRTVSLLPEQTPFQIGRDPHKAQLLIETELASREHCHIEFRRGKYVLVDHSTNGTYVYVDEQTPIYLRREEAPLQGTGVISVGQQVDPANPWLIQYQH